jgi:hypothetical protein
MRPLCAALVLIAAACASAPATKVGWDQNVTFSNYHTWAWRPDGSIDDPTWARRCQDVLSDQLKQDGLTQVPLDRNPDLWALMHVRLSAENVVTPFDPNWGYAWGAWAPIDDYETEIPIGTIIVDLVDAKLKQIVWRGRAKDAIDPGKSNEAREEKLRAVLAQLFAGYPPAAGAKAAGKRRGEAGAERSEGPTSATENTAGKGR